MGVLIEGSLNQATPPVRHDTLSDWRSAWQLFWQYTDFIQQTTRGADKVGQLPPRASKFYRTPKIIRYSHTSLRWSRGGLGKKVFSIRFRPGRAGAKVNHRPRWLIIQTAISYVRILKMHAVGTHPFGARLGRRPLSSNQHSERMIQTSCETVRLRTLREFSFYSYAEDWNKSMVVYWSLTVK